MPLLPPPLKPYLLHPQPQPSLPLSPNLSSESFSPTISLLPPPPPQTPAPLVASPARPARYPPTIMAFVSGPALPSVRTARAPTACPLRMGASSPEAPLSRRALLAGLVAAATAATLPKSALADREYPNVGYLGGSDVIDINNANVRAYTKYQGFYPTLAGLIVANGPYDSVNDLYDLPGLTDDQKKALDKYKENLIALEPAAEYEIDKFNNGLYR